MSHLKYLSTAGALAFLVLAGCGGGSDSGPVATVPTPTTPTPAANPELTPFVRQLFTQTTETNDPAPIDSLTFGTADDTNDTAYNDILAR
jgi:hypothetical protein